MKDVRVFVGVNEPSVPAELAGDKFEMKNMQSCRIPSLLTVKDTVIAACDKANCGADWGFIEIAVRRSADNGKTFDKLNTVFTPPARIAPKKDEEYTSAFAIDPVMVEAEDGAVVVVFDFYPECKGLHKADLLEKSNGYVEIDGKKYLKLYDSDKNIFTVREDCFVYDSDGRKTAFYLPPIHSSDNSYQTIGDMYMTDGEPEFITACPPLFPDNSHDKYVGNIYLQRSENDILVKTKKYSEDVAYECIESSAAPFTAPVTSYLFVMKSYDNGKSWTQPADITPMVKTDDDDPFFGVGPGVGLRLSNGRLLIPVYSVGTAFVIYSDDNGDSWKRTGYCENLDECQLVEYSDGTIGCFGRPAEAGNLVYSISKDNGITWMPLVTELYTARCQHSVISVPKKIYTDSMDYASDYILCSRPTGHRGADATRTDGYIALGKILGDYSVDWISEKKIKTDEIYSVSEKWADFFAYSCLSVLPDNEIGILYESFPSGYISFTKFTLDDILKGDI